ncbi:hypothetical protein SH580_10425 [Coraliomargarita algicola]|uniref:30S ribosomal protein S21 n=1 Tax=Coraliomargarita algicola TaxID=3092156 RepID=A0ABZ0RPE8_9BACT|nr:hypothetical protein [Coraliomargarita sp. J2-16]WPJ98114.1 hypothetical protein SH580_10425 [Coraliomargarita sp. J2-16]
MAAEQLERFSKIELYSEKADKISASVADRQSRFERVMSRCRKSKSLRDSATFKRKIIGQYLSLKDPRNR